MEIYAVAWQASAGFRRARYNHTGGGLVSVIDDLKNLEITNMSITVDSTIDGKNLKLAFVSILTNTGVSIISTTANTKKPAGGIKKIHIVYIPAGVSCSAGGPPPAPIVYLDAFNMDAGEFSDCEFFVHVIDNNRLNQSLTDSANNDGMVPTTNTETLAALQTISDSWGNPKFHDWQQMGGQTLPNLNFPLAAGDNYVVFAFYKTPAIPCFSSIPAHPCHTAQALCTAGIPIHPCPSAGPINLCHTAQALCPASGPNNQWQCHASGPLICPSAPLTGPGCQAGASIIVPPMHPGGDPAITGKTNTLQKPKVKRERKR